MIVITCDSSKKAVLDAYCEGRSWLWRQFFGFRNKYMYYDIPKRDFAKLQEIHSNYFGKEIGMDDSGKLKIGHYVK